MARFVFRCDGPDCTIGEVSQPRDVMMQHDADIPPGWIVRQQRPHGDPNVRHAFEDWNRAEFCSEDCELRWLVKRSVERSMPKGYAPERTGAVANGG